MFVSAKRKSSPEQRSLSLSLSTYRPPSFWQAHAAVAVEAAPLLAPAPALPLAPKERERERDGESDRKRKLASERESGIDRDEGKKGIFFLYCCSTFATTSKEKACVANLFLFSFSLSLSLSLSLSFHVQRWRAALVSRAPLGGESKEKRGLVISASEQEERCRWKFVRRPKKGTQPTFSLPPLSFTPKQVLSDVDRLLRGAFVLAC